MNSASVDGTVLCALDEVAWFLNLRGEDVDFNPVFISYVVVTHDIVRLYVDATKITPPIREHLGSQIEIKPYNAVFDDLKQFSAENKVCKNNISILITYFTFGLQCEKNLLLLLQFSMITISSIFMITISH
jgi:hypothetical protein